VDIVHTYNENSMEIKTEAEAVSSVTFDCPDDKKPSSGMYGFSNAIKYKYVY